MHALLSWAGATSLCSFLQVHLSADLNSGAMDLQGEPGSFLGLEGGLKGKENGYPGGIFDPLGFSKYVIHAFSQPLSFRVCFS